jgi:hypothetical protein
VLRIVDQKSGASLSPGWHHITHRCSYRRATLTLSGKAAFVGIAFNQRADAFDFNVAISDWKK